MGEKNKKQTLAEIKALVDVDEISNIVFENHDGKTLGDCSMNVAKAIVKYINSL